MTTLGHTNVAHDAFPALAWEMPCALVALDDAGDLRYWNPAASRLLGWTAEEARSRPWSDLLAALAENHASTDVKLRHREGYEVSVRVRPCSQAPAGWSACFLEPASSLFDATRRVMRELLDRVPAHFAVFDRNLNSVLACQASEKLLGKPREALEGPPVRDLLGEADFESLLPPLQQALEGQVVEGETRIVGADGKPHRFRYHFCPLAISGEIDAVFAFGYDISDLHQTEETLRNSERRLQALIDHNPDFILILDRELRIRFLNRSAVTARPEDLYGYDILSFSPPAYRDWLRREFEVARQTGQPRDIETPVHWQGRDLWFSSRIVAIPDERGEAGNLLLVARDTTSRRQMEQELRESEARFREFADALEDVIWIVELDPERMAFISRAFERVWGIPSTKLLENARLWTDAIHPEDRARVGVAWQAVCEGRASTLAVEYRIIRPDGEVRWVHDSGKAVPRAHGRPRISGIARDISERKRIEAEEAVFQQQLQQTQKLESLGVLAGGIAHDFNNLLSGILGNVNLVQLDVPSGNPASGLLAQIEVLCLRAADLCKQMLAYAGKGRISVGQVDLNQLVQESRQVLGISVSRKTTLHVQVGAELPAVRGDFGQIRQVLLNLVINASESFGDRPGAVHVATGRMTVSAEDLAKFQFGTDLSPGEFAFLEVRDNGPGISEEMLPRIFEPFFSTKFTGRGLGLAAVQGIVRSHQGALRVRSVPGEGAVFTLLFPFAASPVAVASPTAPAGEILVVEDDPVLGSILVQMLSAFGYTVHLASSTAETLPRFRERHPSLGLVLLDASLPQASAEELLNAFQDIDARVPVVLVSSFPEGELTTQFAGRPIAGILQKPFRMERLQAVLTAAVSRK